MKNVGPALELALGAVTGLLILKLLISRVLIRQRRLSSLYQLTPYGAGTRPLRTVRSSTAWLLSTFDPFRDDHATRGVQLRSPRVSSVQRDAERLIAEAEAYLDGSYVERTPSDGCENCLVVVNHLAHADRDRLAQWVGTRPHWSAHLQAPWRDAAVFLASEVLRRCGSAAELKRVQRSVLVPLELDLLRHRGLCPDPRPLLGWLSRASIGRSTHHE
jgi:hypothetical protein